MILFLSAVTKNSRALREEIDYAINQKGLPIIVVYPDFKYKSDIISGNSIREQISILWDNIPVFRDNKHKVPVIHIPLDKELISQSISHDWFSVITKSDKKGDYWWKTE